jgi:hypothetical protein
MILAFVLACCPPAVAPPNLPPATPARSTACPTFVPHALGHVDDEALDELSGIAASRTNPGSWWLHNDSGDRARVFLLDHQARRVATYAVTGADAVDWEDIAVAGRGAPARRRRGLAPARSERSG